MEQLHHIMIKDRPLSGLGPPFPRSKKEASSGARNEP